MMADCLGDESADGVGVSGISATGVSCVVSMSARAMLESDLRLCCLSSYCCTFQMQGRGFWKKRPRI
jgi:hypothetical protein